MFESHYNFDGMMHYLSIEKSYHLFNPTSLSYYLSVVQSIRLPVDSTFKRIKKYNAISFLVVCDHNRLVWLHELFLKKKLR